MHRSEKIVTAIWIIYVLIAIAGAWLKFDWAAGALVLLGALFGARVYAGLCGLAGHRTKRDD